MPRCRLPSTREAEVTDLDAATIDRAARQAEWRLVTRFLPAGLLVVAGDCEYGGYRVASEAVAAAIHDDRGPYGHWVRVAAALSPFQDSHEVPDRRLDVARNVSAERLLEAPRKVLVIEQPT